MHYDTSILKWRFTRLKTTILTNARKHGSIIKHLENQSFFKESVVDGLNERQGQRIFHRRERTRRVKRTEIVVPTFYRGYCILTLAKDMRCKKTAELDTSFFFFSTLRIEWKRNKNLGLVPINYRFQTPYVTLKL